MNKIDLAARLARQLHRSRAKAADEVDALVYKLLKSEGPPPDEKASSKKPDRRSGRRASKDRQ